MGHSIPSILMLLDRSLSDSTERLLYPRIGETTIAFVILKAEETDVKSCESSINERVAKNIAKFAVPGQFLGHQRSFETYDLFQLKFTS